MGEGLRFLTVDAIELESLAFRIDYLRVAISDLRPLFEQFSADFYKDEKRVFQLKSAGKYADLSEPYGTRKQATLGFKYPILFATGRLAASLLSRDSDESINEIGELEFSIGSRTPYAPFHHFGTSKMPLRRLFDDNPDGRMFERWNRLADAYIDKIVKDAI